MAEIDLRVDEYAADRIRQAVADGIEHGLANAALAERERASGAPDRDRLAAMAMQGWLASFQGVDCADIPGVARFAYAIADAMLAERARQPAAEDPSHG